MEREPRTASHKVSPCPSRAESKELAERFRAGKILLLLCRGSRARHMTAAVVAKEEAWGVGRGEDVREGFRLAPPRADEGRNMTARHCCSSRWVASPTMRSCGGWWCPRGVRCRRRRSRGTRRSSTGSSGSVDTLPLASRSSGRPSRRAGPRSSGAATRGRASRTLEFRLATWRVCWGRRALRRVIWMRVYLKSQSVGVGPPSW